MLREQLEFGEKQNVLEEIQLFLRDNPACRLYVWGCGSVAVGVTRRLALADISVEGYFTDVEGIVADARLGNVEVVPLQELLQMVDEFAVVVGHSHYELVTNIKKYKKVMGIWMLPSVAREDIKISEEFVWENIERLEETYSRLADEISAKNMVNYLNMQVTGDCNWIVRDFDRACTYFCNDVIRLHDHECYLDLGAYNGESIETFLRVVGNQYNRIVGVEVVAPVCEQLRHKEWASRKNVSIMNIGISDHIGQDFFAFDGQGTCLSEEGVAVNVSTVDEICKRYHPVTLIKICIGNSIIPLLRGAEKTIHEDMPKLIIAAGIDTKALVEYVDMIEGIVGKGKYNFYLRFTSASEECLVLFAIPQQERLIR